MALELDHLFLFAPNADAAADMLAAAGLRPNFTRVHPGQGTTNICAYFDNAFLEILWLDGTVMSAPSRDLGLYARGMGRGSPLGISWRGEASFDQVPYHAPYLPAGVSIPIAKDSLPVSRPLLFQSPGGTAPRDRPDGPGGQRQLPELGTIGACRLYDPEPEVIRSHLKSMKDVEVLDGQAGLELDLMATNGDHVRTLRWVFPNGGYARLI